MAGARPQWLIALGACLALVALPLLAWWLLPLGAVPRPPAPEPPPPILAPDEPRPEDDTEGLRLITGVVSDSEGEALGGIQVRVDGGSIADVSAPDGRFALEGVTLEPVAVVARGTGYEEARLDVAAGEAGDREELEITLEPARAVEGQVLDVEGEPVAKAVVTCVDHGDDPSLGTLSDEAGSFTLPAKAVGCEAIARHRDHGDAATVTLRAGEGNRLRLTEPASIEGYVVDERGSPLTTGVVGIESFTAADGSKAVGRRGVQAKLDARGEFRFDKLQAGTYVLAASADGRPPAQSERVTLVTGERVRGIRIDLPRGAELTGRVTAGDSGEPVAGATVALDAVAMTMVSRVRPVKTDEEGRYVLDGVPAGPFSISVSAPGFNRRVVPGIETGGAAALNRDFELSASDGKAVTEYSGIGARLGKGPDGLILAHVVAEGPSEEAGLQKRDVIVMIDGRDAREITVSQAVQLLRGETGTRVSMTIERGGERLDVVVTRGTFTQ